MDTLAITVSRRTIVRHCLEAINESKLPAGLGLFILVDSMNEELIDYCKNYKWKYQWASKEVLNTPQDPVRVSSIKDYQRKWNRIMSNMRLVREFTKESDIVLMVEDDTIIPPNALIKLYNKIKSDKKIGCIQGVEALRNAGGHGPCGAWRLDIEKGIVKRKLGLGAKKSGIEQIDGGGYYCWAFRQKAIQQIKFRADIDNGWCGPDIWTWYDIGQNGWKALIDWSIWCIHLEEDLTTITPEKTRNWLYDFRKSKEYPKMDYNYEEKVIHS